MRLIAMGLTENPTLLPSVLEWLVLSFTDVAAACCSAAPARCGAFQKG